MDRFIKEMENDLNTVQLDIKLEGVIGAFRGYIEDVRWLHKEIEETAQTISPKCHPQENRGEGRFGLRIGF